MRTDQKKIAMEVDKNSKTHVQVFEYQQQHLIIVQEHFQAHAPLKSDDDIRMSLHCEGLVENDRMKDKGLQFKMYHYDSKKG